MVQILGRPGIAGTVGGWSYEEVHVSSKRRGSSSSSSSEVGSAGGSDSSGFLNNHRRFTTRFRGPWVGFDFAYLYSDPCEDIRLRFEGGYEYHWANLRGTARFENCFCEDGTDRIRFRSNNAWANVAWLQGWWTLCDNIEVGLGVKWQSWEAKRRHRNSSSSSSSFSSSDSEGGRQKRSGRVTWDSVAVNADLGYSF